MTKILAVYGALLSSIGCGWALYRDTHDRGKIRVSAGLKRIAQAADGSHYALSKRIADEVGAPSQLYIVISFTNVGRRPVMLKGWAGRYRKPKNGQANFVVVPADMPKMLKEGEYHNEMTEDLRGGDENTVGLYVYDSAGKKWWLPRKEMKVLQEEVRAARNEESRINSQEV